jgi:addiction module RelE/StbE family toxin
MAFDLKYLPLFHHDLMEIDDYLAQYAPQAANKIFSELFNRLGKLPNNPLMYAEYEYDTFYRKIVVESYIVFYHVNNEKRIIEIHRLLHSARNVSKILRDENSQ